MNFKDHPVNHDHKHSPQSEQAGENDGFLQSLRSSIQHFKKEGKGEFAAGILLAVNRYKEYAALWQAASQEKGVGWVSIADNLHENITVQTNDCTIDVLVRTNNADSPNAVAFYNKKRKGWWLSEKDDVELTVTHWMKLPALSAPPKPNNE